MKALRLAVRLSGFCAALIILLPPHLVLFGMPRLRHGVPLLFFRFMIWLMGVRIDVTGPLPKRGTLIASNHVSWFDIMIIGGLMPLSFIAKSEVKAWPFFGHLARLHHSVFVDRRVGRHTLKERAQLAERLRRGDSLVLFAEGTSSHGLRVLPFKSTLFSVIEHLNDMPDGEDTVPVQAMTLAYTRVHNIAMGRRQRVAYGWVGDMTLLPHFFFMLAGPPLTVEIIFHPPLDHVARLSRKPMAQMLHYQVSGGLEALARGAPHPVAPLEMTGQKS
ncbi:MAG: 1-acyl-sn-glycerol-3-phosphate acyltransferase [Alphaproteobacteria bacterium]|nr:1-acyl-sn-glycerol-3-phosphate acyltransferase [Alphaproteobacteria bacterium]